MVLQYVVISSGASVTSLLLGVFALVRGPRKDLVSRFFLWALCISWIVLSDALRKYHYTLQDPLGALFWAKMAALGGIAFVPTFVEFCLAFPPRIERTRRIFLLVTVANTLVFTPLLFTDLLVSGVFETPLSYSSKLGPAVTPFAASFTALVGASFAIFARKMVQRSPYHKYYLLVLAIILVLGVVTVMYPPIQEALYDPPMVSTLSVATLGLFFHLVTKQGFLVVPLVEIPPVETPRYGLSKEKPNFATRRMAYEIVRDYDRCGYPTLCMSPTNPDVLRGEYGLRRALLIRLSNSISGFSVHPEDLVTIEYYLNVFARSAQGGIALIDGLDLLIELNGLDRVVRFVRKAHEAARRQGSALLVADSGKPKGFLVSRVEFEVISFENSVA